MSKNNIRYMSRVRTVNEIKTTDERFIEEHGTNIVHKEITGLVRAVYGNNITVHFPFMSGDLIETVDKSDLELDQ